MKLILRPELIGQIVVALVGDKRREQFLVLVLDRVRYLAAVAIDVDILSAVAKAVLDDIPVAECKVSPRFGQNESKVKAGLISIDSRRQLVAAIKHCAHQRKVLIDPIVQCRRDAAVERLDRVSPDTRNAAENGRQPVERLALAVLVPHQRHDQLDLVPRLKLRGQRLSRTGCASQQQCRY